jgi:hypothetical protein
MTSVNQPRRSALVLRLALTSFFLAHANTSIAQSNLASIVGQVTDESGAVLPGVTVTATSPAL